MSKFLKKAFEDMKESAREQRKVDKANLEAVRAETKAGWEEAKAMANPETYKAIIQKERDEQVAESEKRKAAAQKRIDDAKGTK